MPEGFAFGTRKLSIAVFGGAAARFLGDLALDGAADVLGTRSTVFPGMEMGVLLEIGNARLEPRLTYLFGTNSDPLPKVSGLASLQVGVNASFVLPWEVLGTKPASAPAAPASATVAHPVAPAPATTSAPPSTPAPSVAPALAPSPPPSPPAAPPDPAAPPGPPR